MNDYKNKSESFKAICTHDIKFLVMFQGTIKTRRIKQSNSQKKRQDERAFSIS